uniref:hypothetical protein n=1 Tax=Agathobacter sp. TaxID=2021311 RepID=UPI004057BA14
MAFHYHRSGFEAGYHALRACRDLLTKYRFACGRPMGYLFPKQNGEDKPIDTFESAHLL